MHCLLQQLLPARAQEIAQKRPSRRPGQQWGVCCCRGICCANLSAACSEACVEIMAVKAHHKQWSAACAPQAAVSSMCTTGSGQQHVQHKQRSAACAAQAAVSSMRSTSSGQQHVQHKQRSAACAPSVLEQGGVYAACDCFLCIHTPRLSGAR
jgi:hypothetical protein